MRIGVQDNVLSRDRFRRSSAVAANGERHGSIATEKIGSKTFGLRMIKLNRKVSDKNCVDKKICSNGIL